MKYSIKAFIILLSVGFLAACNGVQQLNCDDRQLEFSATAMKNDTEEMERLWQTGWVELDAHCKKHFTVLMYATLKGAKKSVEWALNKGSDPNIVATRPKTSETTTALSIAVAKNYTSIAKLLLDAGADPDFKDHEGFTCLMLAAKDNQLSIMKALLKAGANPDIQDKNGRTAIMFSALEGRSSTVKALLEYSTDPHLQDKDGNSAYYYAVINGHGKDIGRLLLDWEPEILRSKSYSVNHDQKQSHSNPCVVDNSNPREGNINIDNSNKNDVNVTVPGNVPSSSIDNRFNIEVNPRMEVSPIFQAPQPEGTDADVACCSSFLKCLKCVFPFLAAL